jgi:hypothetical protein
MRRSLIYIFLAVALLGSVTRSSAQRYLDEYQVFYGGLIGGLNFTQIDGDDIKGYSKVGFNAGGIVYARLDDHVAASLEILYSQKGSRLPSAIQLNTGEYITYYKIKLNYAEIPVLINYFVDSKRSHFGGGFSYSQLASSKEDLQMTPSSGIFDQTKYPFKKADLNIVLGGDLHLYHGLFLNIRFQYSLISIRNHAPTDAADVTQFNNLWVTRLMYLF